MKKFNRVNPVKNLPDNYSKKTTSNNYKILQIEKEQLNNFASDLQLIEKVSNINFDLTTATNDEKQLFTATLNLYGEMFNQNRGAMTDEQYRMLIKSKVMQNLSTGTCNSVIEAICVTFNCSPSEVLLIESSTDCAITIEALPLSELTRAGFSVNQAVQIIKKLLPIGVKLDSLSFDGTFEFSANESDLEVDGAAKGFTDIEANMQNETAIGGYLGWMSNGNNENLPI